MDDPQYMAFALIPLVVIVGVFVLLALAIWRGGKLREHSHRERLAMIEKGLVPPPEVDPIVSRARTLQSQAGQRFRTLGVTLIGLGIGVALIIAMAANQLQVGLGVGGAIVALGVAMVVNGLLSGRPAEQTEGDGLPAVAPAPPREP